MTAITLGFKAFDAHELLVHFVASEAGLYRHAGLQVELADITFVAEAELPVHWFQASCGAALASAVKGIAQRVVLVAVDRPMFWIYARPGLDGLAGLKNRRLATFPAVAPPHHLANIVLSRSGLDPAREVQLHCARDDVARLGLLMSGNVDAAVISSAVAPARLAALGFNMICFLGDEIRVPTTGLGIDQRFLQQQPQLVGQLVAAQRQALALIHDDPERVARVLVKCFDLAEGYARPTAGAFRPCYTADGLTPAAIAQAAIDALCRSLNVGPPPPWQDIYSF
jgi:NitT/TauT family transport system substrate-binding protein